MCMGACLSVQFSTYYILYVHGCMSECTSKYILHTVHEITFALSEGKATKTTHPAILIHTVCMYVCTTCCILCVKS